jgi:hypothetical protein
LVNRGPARSLWPATACGAAWAAVCFVLLVD